MTDQYNGPWSQPSSNAPGSTGPTAAPPPSNPEDFASPQPGYGAPQPGYGSTQDSFGPPSAAQGFGQPGQDDTAYGYSAHSYGYAGPEATGMAPGAAVPIWIRPDYAPWIKRVGAYLIDQALALVGSLVFYYGYILFLLDVSRSQQVSGTAGLTPMIIGIAMMVLSTAWNIYNRYLVAGRTGQSLGKRVTHLRLIDETSGQPVGALNAFLRDLMHILDGMAYVGYLWPLWDEKKQTFADKLMKSIVVEEASQDARGEWPRKTQAEETTNRI